MSAPFPSPTKIWHTTAYSSIIPTLPALSAAGKSILITGGGSGIGAATAHAYAAASATRIALLGRRSGPLLETQSSIQDKHPHVSVSIFPTDITDQAAVDAAFATFASGSDHGIDVVLSNAGFIGPQAPLASVPSSAFLAAVQTNVAGALHVAQAFLRHAAPDAMVVETNSSAAHVDFGDGFAAYSVAKMGVARLWDALAGASPGVRVFHVQPGVVDTDMNREAGGVKAMGFEDHVSLPAGFNLWLASEEARFLKGRFLWANWDVEELKARREEIEKGTQFKIGLIGWPFGETNWPSSWNSSENE